MYFARRPYIFCLGPLYFSPGLIYSGPQIDFKIVQKSTPEPSQIWTTWNSWSVKIHLLDLQIHTLGSQIQKIIRKRQTLSKKICKSFPPDSETIYPCCMMFSMHCAKKFPMHDSKLFAMHGSKVHGSSIHVRKHSLCKVLRYFPCRVRRYSPDMVRR